MRWYRVARKLRLNGIALRVLSPFCANRKETMSPEEAEALLNALRPRKPVTCVRAHERAWTEPSLDVSVIIPTWNNGPWIEASIESVLRQKTGHTFEVIVVDDGSTDDTADKLQAYASDPRVVIVHQPNQGVSAARNKGLELARGKYLYFLDGDDLLLPDMLETLTAAAEEHGAAVVEGGYRLALADGSARELPCPAAGEIGDRKGFTGFVCGKLFQRELFRRICFPDCSYEDSIMTQILVPMVLQGHMTAWGVSQPVFSYRYNPSGITRSITSTPKAAENLYITEALMKDRRTLGLPYTQGYYEHLLDMMALGWVRAEGLPEEDRRAMFILFRRLLLESFPESRTSQPSQERLEAAVKAGCFK